jgi:hypothetical protein
MALTATRPKIVKASIWSLRLARLHDGLEGALCALLSVIRIALPSNYLGREE